MRLHSDIITADDLRVAAHNARVGLTFTAHGSRCRARAFEVHLTGNSNRRPQNPQNRDDYAATWDQWGTFFAYLYDIDHGNPGMIVGSSARPVYSHRDNFHDVTFGRFDTADSDSPFWPADYHGDHSWNVRACRKCSAQR